MDTWPERREGAVFSEDLRVWTRGFRESTVGSTQHTMLAILSSTLAFSLPLAPPLRAAHQRLTPRMGLFDGLKKAFDNVDYSDSPATYEQTNARASHILVADEAQVGVTP